MKCSLINCTCVCVYAPRTLRHTHDQLAASVGIAHNLETQLACAVFERDVLERSLQVRLLWLWGKVKLCLVFLVSHPSMNDEAAVLQLWPTQINV